MPVSLEALPFRHVPLTLRTSAKLSVNRRADHGGFEDVEQGTVG